MEAKMTRRTSQDQERVRVTDSNNGPRKSHLLFENPQKTAAKRSGQMGLREVFTHIPNVTVLKAVAYTPGLSYEGLLNANADLQKRLDETTARLNTAEHKLAELTGDKYEAEAALRRKEMELRDKEIAIVELKTTIKVLIDGADYL
jgi:hypothetical protein